MRKVEERWAISKFNVITEELPLADNRGRAVHDALGAPKMETYTSLVFVLNEPGCHRTILIPLTDDGRKELVRMLTGGIVVPTPGSNDILAGGV